MTSQPTLSVPSTGPVNSDGQSSKADCIYNNKSIGHYTVIYISQNFEHSSRKGAFTNQKVLKVLIVFLFIHENICSCTHLKHLTEALLMEK